MTISSLAVQQAHTQTLIPATQGKAVIVHTTPDGRYQLKDAQGNKVGKFSQKKVGNDLWVFDEANVTAEPDFILKDYYTHNALLDSAVLDDGLLGNTALNGGESVASEVASLSGTPMTSAGTVAAAHGVAPLLFAPVALGGVAAAIHSHDNHKENNSSDTNTNNTTPISPVTPVNPTPITPVTPTTPVIADVTINDVGTVNKATLQGTVELSGTVITSSNATSTNVVVTINGTDYPATVNGTTWTVTVAGSVLAYSQGTNSITAKVTATDGTQTATDTANTNYTVDTVIAKPIITINTIAGDDVIDYNESQAPTQTITGKVIGLGTDETVQSVILTVDGQSFTATVNNGTFSQSIPTSILTANTAITATVNTYDMAGNSESNTTSHVYTLNLAPPVNPTPITPVTPTTPVTADITMNDVGTVNKAAAQGTVELSGTVTTSSNTTSTNVIVTINGADYPATVNGTTWTVTVAGSVLAYSQGTNSITAKVTATDGTQTATDTANISYTVDTLINEPQIVIDPITPDNIINASEATRPTTITGKVTGLGTGETVQSVVLTVGGQTFTATVNNGTFSQSVPANLITANTAINATVTTTDTAGNTATTSTAKSYGIDTTANVSVSIDAINNGQVINAATKAQGVTLTGKITLDNDIDPSSVVVTATINGQNYNATVNTTNKTWQLPLTINSDGAMSASVRITATDNAGNTAAHSTTANYTVDTQASVSIALDAITGDNVIQLSEKDTTTTITGKVTGDFLTTDKVTIRIGTATYQADIGTDGRFSQTVAVNDLISQPSPSVTASISTSDNAGNPAAASISLPYRIETATPDNTAIHITSIANDNLVNVTEATKDITIKGTVSGDNVKAGDTVTLSLNNKTFNGTVDSTGKAFSATISGSELINNTGYKVTAQLNNASDNASYSVDANAIASIRINAIDDNALGSDDGSDIVRITGKLNLTGEWAKGDNAKYIRSITATIGQNTYNTGVDEDDQSFFIDIPASELVALNGQAINFSVDYADTIVALLHWGNNYAGQEQAAPALTADDIRLDANSYISSTNGYRINSTALADNDKVHVTGTVTGVASVGDAITLKVGDKSYQGQVNSNKSFDILVSESDLAHANGKVSATLTTKDLAGTAISVTDTASAAIAQAGNGTMVNAHGKIATSELPYFIRSLNIEASIEKSNAIAAANHLAILDKGFLSHADKQIEIVTQHGMTLTYNFDGWFARSSIAMTVVKEALDTISKYTNITFNQVSNTDTADIKYVFENTGYVLNWGGVLGHTWAGQDTVTISKEAYYDDPNFSNNTHQFFMTAIHETLHSLGAEHTFDEEFLEEHPSLKTTKGELLGADSILAKQEDVIGLSVMSYTHNDFNGSNDLRLYDLAYLHYRFGVNDNARSGNDTYTFKDFNQSHADGDIYIWDGNGVDTFDASKESRGVYVNLTPGSWIYSGAQAEKLAATGFFSETITEFFNLTGVNNVLSDDLLSGKYSNVSVAAPIDFTDGQAFIGYDTQLENLVGSSYNDTLIGNNANNAIYGGKGQDNIAGGAGDDYLDGGLGADTLYGGAGNDSYVVDDVNDIIHENAGAGTDTVYSSVNYTLSAHVDNIVLLGNTATTATGNDLANTMIANDAGVTLQGLAGDDTLIGGLGADRLDGGLGADTYVFSTTLNGTLDTLVMDRSDKIALDSSIFTVLTKGNNANVLDFIKYDSTTHTLSYDSDNGGVVDAIAFAQVEGDFNYTIDKFTVI